MQRNAEFLTAGMKGISTFYFFSLSLVSSGIICCRVTNPSTLALTRNVYQGFPSRSLHGCFFFLHLPCKKKKKKIFLFIPPVQFSLGTQHRVVPAELHRMEYLTFPLCCPHFTVLLLGLVIQTSVQILQIKSHFHIMLCLGTEFLPALTQAWLLISIRQKKGL